MAILPIGLPLAPLMAVWDIPQLMLRGRLAKKTKPAPQVMKCTHSTRNRLLLWLDSLRDTASDGLRQSLEDLHSASSDKEAEHNAKRRQRAGPRQDFRVGRKQRRESFQGSFSGARSSQGSSLSDDGRRISIFQTCRTVVMKVAANPLVTAVAKICHNVCYQLHRTLSTTTTTRGASSLTTRSTGRHHDHSAQHRQHRRRSKSQRAMFAVDWLNVDSRYFHHATSLFLLHPRQAQFPSPSSRRWFQLEVSMADHPQP